MGLPFELAALFGGVMVVTGPTVIAPMLRSLNIAPRVKNMLKWEGIVNDPIGALLAVGIYSYITHGGADANSVSIVTDVVAASVLAILIGGAAGFLLTWAFPRGYVPEFLKSPVLLITVIGVFTSSPSTRKIQPTPKPMVSRSRKAATTPTTPASGR